MFAKLKETPTPSSSPACLQIEDYDVVASMMAARCRFLTSLDLWRCRNLTDRGLAELVSGCRWVEGNTTGVGDNCLVKMLSYSVTLKQNCTLKSKMVGVNGLIGNSSFKSVIHFCFEIFLLGRFLSLISTETLLFVVFFL